MPVGSVIMYAGATAPAGYLECNGQSTASYAALAAIVGANVPDLRGEFVRGWDNSAGVDSGRALLSSQADSFGSHNHSLTSNGTHNHSLGSAGTHVHPINSVGNHIHSEESTTGGTDHDGSGGGIKLRSEIKNTSTGAAGGHNHSMNNAGNHNHSLANAGTHAHTVGSTGSTENRPRNIALMYCIKF